MRDPDKWEAEFFHPDGYLYYHQDDKRQSTTIASLIREAQEDGARYANLHCRMDRTKRLRTIMRSMGIDVDQALTIDQLEDMMDQAVANLIKRAEVAEAKVLVLQQEIATSHFYLNQLR